jgi:hypothetical protein
MIPVKLIESLEEMNLEEALAPMVPLYDFVNKINLCAQKDLSKISLSEILLFAMQMGNANKFAELKNIIKPFVDSLDGLDENASKFLAMYINLNMFSIDEDGNDYKKLVNEIRRIVDTRETFMLIRKSVMSFIDQLREETKEVRFEVLEHISPQNNVYEL